jgi:hypothetical protein
VNLESSQSSENVMEKEHGAVLLTMEKERRKIAKNLFLAETELLQRTFGPMSHKALCYKILTLRTELSTLDETMLCIAKQKKQ